MNSFVTGRHLLWPDRTCLGCSRVSIWMVLQYRRCLSLCEYWDWATNQLNVSHKHTSKKNNGGLWRQMNVTWTIALVLGGHALLNFYLFFLWPSLHSVFVSLGASEWTIPHCLAHGRPRFCKEKILLSGLCHFCFCYITSFMLQLITQVVSPFFWRVW